MSVHIKLFHFFKVIQKGPTIFIGHDVQSGIRFRLKAKRVDSCSSTDHHCAVFIVVKIADFADWWIIQATSEPSFWENQVHTTRSFPRFEPNIVLFVVVSNIRHSLQLFLDYAKVSVPITTLAVKDMFDFRCKILGETM